jgi:hypothetical protein
MTCTSLRRALRLKTDVTLCGIAAPRDRSLTAFFLWDSPLALMVSILQSTPHHPFMPSVTIGTQF